MSINQDLKYNLRGGEKIISIVLKARGVLCGAAEGKNRRRGGLKPEAAAQRAATRPLFNSAVTGAQCGLLPQTIAFTKTCTGGEESSTLQTQRSNEI